MSRSTAKINAAVFHRSMLLDEPDLEPLDQRCLFCDSSSRVDVFKLQDDPDVSLLQCQDCYATSASRMPTESALATYYGKYYESSPSESSDGEITFDEPLRLARRLAHSKHRFDLDSPLSILDFGGGDGTISYLLASQLLERGISRVDVTVVEYNKNMVASRDPRITMHRVDSLEDIGNQQYGYVIASAVIEHFARPQVMLRGLLDRMEDGGLFYARTPNIVPIMRLFGRVGIKIDFTYPGHLHDLGQAFWDNYFSSEDLNDYRVLESRPSIVETTLSKNFLRTVAARVFKAPWHLLGRSYDYVGGWEVFVQRKSAAETT